MQEIFSDMATVAIKIYEPYMDQYKLSSIENMVLFQQSRSESDESDRLNDRDMQKGYCDSTAVKKTSAIKIDDRFYTASIPNNVGFQNELITPYFTEREAPDTVEHSVMIPLYGTYDADEIVSVYGDYDIPMYVIVKTTANIEAFQEAGIKVIGFIDTEGSTASIDAAIMSWANAEVDGLYFDDLGAGESYLSDAVSVADSYGFSFYVGDGDFPALLDVMVTDSEYDDTVRAKFLTSTMSTPAGLFDYYYIYWTQNAGFSTFTVSDLETLLSDIEAYYE